MKSAEVLNFWNGGLPLQHAEDLAFQERSASTAEEQAFLMQPGSGF